MRNLFIWIVEFWGIHWRAAALPSYDTMSHLPADGSPAHVNKAGRRMCTRMRVHYTRGHVFPCTMSPTVSVQAQVAQSNSILAQTNISNSSCPVSCLKNNGGRKRRGRRLRRRSLILPPA